MKLSLRSIGGFVGPAAPELKQLDLASLTSELAQHVRSQVDAAHFFGLPAKILKASPKSWDFLHELTIDDVASGQNHQVQFHADAADIALNELLQTIRQLGA